MMMCHWDSNPYNFNATSNIETSAQLKFLLVVHFIFDCINDRDRFHAFNNTYEKKNPIFFSFQINHVHGTYADFDLLLLLLLLCLNI